MSNLLAVRSPRISAIGLDWAEDFSRGKAAVEKNGGEFVGNVYVNGRWFWCELGSGNQVRYRKIALGCDEITVGIWYCDCPAGSSNWSWLFAQRNSAVNSEFGFQIRPSDGGAFVYMTINGTEQHANISDPSVVTRKKPHLIAATWKTGSNLKLFVDGEVVNSSGPYSGVVTPNGSVSYLSIGSQSLGGSNAENKMGDPILVRRAWSDEGVKEHYKRGLYH